MTGAAVETLRHGGSHQLFQDLWSVIRVKAGSDSREKRAVLKLEADAGGNAVGHSYLIRIRPGRGSRTRSPGGSP